MKTHEIILLTTAVLDSTLFAYVSNAMAVLMGLR